MKKRISEPHAVPNQLQEQCSSAPVLQTRAPMWTGDRSHCPECGQLMAFQGRCGTCLSCGYSACH